MRRTMLVLLAAVLVAGLVSTSDARGHRGGRGCGPMPPCPAWMDSSVLPTDVRDRIAKERQAFEAETVDLRADLFKKVERMRLLMADASSKDDDIMKLHQEIQALQGQLAKKRLEHILKVRKILPEGIRGRPHLFGWGPGCGGMGPCCCMGMGRGPGRGPGMGGGPGAPGWCMPR